MGLWEGLRSRLFGEGEPDERRDENLTPPAPLSCEERGETKSLLPPLLADAGIPPGGEAPSSVEEGGWGGEVSARQERAAGRILDDEGLRGDLTDDEYQPLLDWALSVTDRVAAGTAEQDDQQADATIDAGIGVVREVVRSAGDAVLAHNEGRADDRRWALDVVSQTWKPSIVGDDETDLPATLWQPLQRLADRLDAEPDLPGSAVAVIIIAALTPPEPPT